MLSASPEKKIGRRREGRNKHFHNIMIDGGQSKPFRNNSPNRNLDHFRLLQGKQMGGGTYSDFGEAIKVLILILKGSSLESWRHFTLFSVMLRRKDDKSRHTNRASSDLHMN